MFQPKFSWNDYFSGTSITTTLGPGLYTSRRTYSEGSIYVSNCLFNQFTSGSSGGALYFSSSVTNLLIESSSFFSCKTSSGGGGAIYFSNSGGQCVLYGVCGNDCCTTSSSSFQFGYISVNNAISSKNYINYSSIVRCVNANSGSDTLRILNGNILCLSINMSMNKCLLRPVFLCNPFTDTSSITCSISYSSFTDNNALDCLCLQFDRGGPKYEIKCCNILRNTQDTSSWGLIYAYGSLNIKDCCILENKATYIFYANNHPYIITLSNCTVDKTSSYGSFIIQNTITKSFIHGLHHISTQNCNAKYDLVGTLSAIPYVPSPTKKEFCYYYTCKMNHCQGKIGVFFSITWMLLVAFIHPNPSVDF
jgi:hypothetical protein